jgi:DNA repair protein RadC
LIGGGCQPPSIVGIARTLGISVHDHIIVGKNGHASMKGLRLI